MFRATLIEPKPPTIATSTQSSTISGSLKCSRRSRTMSSVTKRAPEAIVPAKTIAARSAGVYASLPAASSMGR